MIPWTAACQAFLSVITSSLNLLKFIAIELVMNYLENLNEEVYGYVFYKIRITQI